MSGATVALVLLFVLGLAVLALGCLMADADGVWMRLLGLGLAALALLAIPVVDGLAS